MLRTTCWLTLLLSGSAAAAQQGANSERLAISSSETLVYARPTRFNAELTRDPDDGFEPALRLRTRDASGGLELSFKLRLRPERGARSVEQLQSDLRPGCERYAAGSTGQSPVPRVLPDPGAVGAYCSYTERELSGVATLRPGQFRNVTLALVSAGDRVFVVRGDSNSLTNADYRDALKLLASLRIEASGGAPAVPQAAATGAADARLIGAWELERYDNIPASEQPPAGMYNLQYTFDDSGTLENFVADPSSRARRSRGKSPYRLSDERFAGFLGLTNDPSGTARVVSLQPGEFVLEYPDGSIATLRRIGASPSTDAQSAFHCIPYTLRGSYDAQFVAGLRRTLRESADLPDMLPQLLGRWKLPSGDPNRALTLEFRAAGRYEKSQRARMMHAHAGEPSRVEWSEPYVESGRYQLHGDVLTIFDEDSCNPARMRFRSGKLELSGDGSVWVPLERVQAPGK